MLDADKFVARTIEAAKKQAAKSLGAWLGTAIVDSGSPNNLVRIWSQAGDPSVDDELQMFRLKGFPILAGEQCLVLEVNGRQYLLGSFGGDQGGLANGVFVDQDSNTGATVSSNNSTSVWQTHSSWSVSLPPGKWSVYARAFGMYYNDTANRGADARVNGFATGPTGIGMNSPLANAPFRVEAEVSASNVQGGSSISVVLEYQARTGGTANALHNGFNLIALRTAMQ